jgi:hypothetical protein
VLGTRRGPGPGVLAEGEDAGGRGLGAAMAPTGRRRKHGVADGTRTHDNRNHNPGLYQLSYSHHGGLQEAAGGFAWSVVHTGEHFVF